MASKPSILALFILVLSVEGFVDSESNRSFEWQTLTKRNFSSQIRRNPRVLLMVTFPWSGESRSLMKEIAQMAASKPENLDLLKLMVVYRNTEKMIADFLGATEGITLFWYHQSLAYKYRGRLRAQNILSLGYHLMSLPPEELPLKPINTPEDLKTFLQETDKAVLLLELCGWTPILLENQKDGGNRSGLHVRDVSEFEDSFEENSYGEADQTIPSGRKKTQKGLENEKLGCGIENVHSGVPWDGEFTWANESATSMEVENMRADTGLSCTIEEYQRFKAFLSEFTTIAREYFLPPERQKFGLISKRSLLPYLDVGIPDTWLLMLQFAGCSNCSKILKDGDDLKNILRMHGPLVAELEGEGHDVEPSLPANRPSIILFVDRSSESSKVRRKSKSALKVFRRLALHYQIPYQTMRGQNIADTKRFSAQAFSGMKSRSISISSDRTMMQVSNAPKMVKFKDKMAFMIVNEGGTFTLDNVDAKGNPAYDILAQLLQQKNPALQKKQAKISFLAKEVGFQLLSDDFAVKIADALPSMEETGQSDKSLSSGSMSSEDEISERPIKSIAENIVDSNNGDLLNTITITAVEHEEQPELIDVETTLPYTQDPITYNEGIVQLSPTESAPEVMKGTLVLAECSGVSEDDESCKEKDLGSFMYSTDQPFHSGQESPMLPILEESVQEDHVQNKESVQEGHVQNTKCSPNNSCSDKAAQNFSGDYFSAAVMGNGVDEERNSPKVEKFGDQQIQHQGFKGSFFFSDGGYQLLGALTAGSMIPSVVILDPILQQHYVFPEETNFSYSSLVYFIDKFLNGSLPSYQRSQPDLISSREIPRPPFVNLDFHEADSIPRVTANSFSELVLGFNHCGRGYPASCSDTQNVGHAWKKDVLVLFSNTWCGFCQRMELVVREVYRAFKGYASILKSESKNKGSTMIQDNLDDDLLSELPHIFYMDCTLNDCSSLLKTMGQRELYPALMLFPAEKKDAVSYQGDMSVISIIDFIATSGTNSRHITGNKEFEYHEVLLNSSPVKLNKHQPVESHVSDKTLNAQGQQVVVGSVLIATDKLLGAPPFDTSMILIVKADRNEGFQGLIINKPVGWDMLLELDGDLKVLQQAPLYFGGPLVVHGMPLVSFTKRDIDEGFLEVLPGIYFGDQLATVRVMERIKSGNRSAVDYWFFLGFSSWGWNQLLNELSEGSWHISRDQVGQLDGLARNLTI